MFYWLHAHVRLRMLLAGRMQPERAEYVTRRQLSERKVDLLMTEYTSSSVSDVFGN